MTDPSNYYYSVTNASDRQALESGIPVQTTQANIDEARRLIANRPRRTAETDTRLAGVEAEREKNYNDLMNFLSNVGGGGGMTGGGYNPQPYIDAINEQFRIQSDLLNRSRMQGLNSINQQYQSYLQNIANDFAASQARTQTDRQMAAQRFQDLVSGAEQRQAEIARSMGALGQQGASIAAQQAGNVGALQASNQAQQNYMDRLAQIMAENQRQAQQQGALVQQGARTSLESDFNKLITALEMQRAQGIQQARSGGGGGGGGGGGSKSDKLTAAEREQQAIDDAFISGDPEAVLAVMFQTNPDYADYILNNIPEDIAGNQERRQEYLSTYLTRALTPNVSQAAYGQREQQRSADAGIQALASAGVIPYGALPRASWKTPDRYSTR